MLFPAKWGSVLGLWWIAWFGIIGSLLWIASMELKRELVEHSPATLFSLVFFSTVIAAWIAFFIADSKLTANRQPFVSLLTTFGTALSAFTLVAVFYFVVVAPRVR
jgi:hypothetical protein